MPSKTPTSFIHYFFQDIYNKLGGDNGVCALKGSFVIEEDSTHILLTNLKKLGTESTLKGFLKTHTLFSNCGSFDMYEIKFTKPIIFTCEVNENCYNLECDICKYYQFTSESTQYLFLKFERYETLSFYHVLEAFKTYKLGRNEKKTLTKCSPTTIELSNEHFFYHAENRLFEPKKHEMLKKVYTNDTPPFEIETYIAEKQKYTMCADFTKLRSNDATDCMKEDKCLSNDIYVPNSHVMAMKKNFDSVSIEYALNYGGKGRHSKKRHSKGRHSKGRHSKGRHSKGRHIYKRKNLH